MEDELRWSLLLLGGFFIIGVLAHGLWNIRKNNKAKKPPRIEPQDWQEDDAADDENSTEQFDEYGIGSVRVVSGHTPDTDDSDDEENIAQASDVSSGESVETKSELHPEEESNTPQSETKQPEAKQPEAEKLYASVVSNPKPQFSTKESVTDAGEAIPAPPSFLLKDEASTEPQKAETFSQAEKEPTIDFSLDAQEAPDTLKDKSVEAQKAAPAPVEKPAPRKKTRQSIRRRQEPNFGDDEQMQIDFDDSQKTAPPSDAAPEKPAADAASVGQEVLILNVRAPEDAPISGAALLPMLLTLGFKFGDQDIFHRHVNSNGKGPVLFSLANMFKPGNFDIDNLENFTTRGVSLFMLLPIEGDPHQVFNMMHNAARKIADEFNAQVLDGRRSVLTKQGIQQYVEKIRDFERKRMIAKH